MIKALLASTLVLTVATGCSTTSYRSYYANGQVQQEYQENVIVGTINGVFSGVWTLVGGVLTIGLGPRSNSAYYYTCPGH